MGKPKRKLARSEKNEASAGSDALNPPRGHRDDTTIESINQKTATVNEEYNRVKAELDHENLELQRLTERRTTEQALSKRDVSSIDWTFSMDPGGLYVYGGRSACCFDASSQPCTSGVSSTGAPCKHELCTRARSTGISWKELDTIKWYDVRIQHEKTSRMKGALAKQREVELARLKQAEDEEKSKYARRYNKKQDNPQVEQRASVTGDGVGDQVGPQDLSTVIFEARISMMHVYKYNIIVGARQGNMAAMAKCSDVVSMTQLQKSDPGSNARNLEEQLHKAQIRLEHLQTLAEWYEEKIAEAAKASRNVAYWQQLDLDLDLDGTDPNVIELCTLVKELLNGLGMPIGNIDNVEHAQSLLRHIMSQPGHKKAPKIQKQLEDIQQVICKAQKQAKENRTSPPSTYIPMPTSQGDLRNFICGIFTGQAKQNGREDLTSIYPELVRIEDEAKAEMRQVYRRSLAESPSEVALSLEKIKAKATAKSPAPQVTEKMLDIIVSTLNDISSASAIIEDLDQTSDQILVAKISGLVFTRAEKKAEWLIVACTAIEAMFETANMLPLPERISHALQRVKTSVHTRVQGRRKPAVIPKVSEEDALPSTKATLQNVGTGKDEPLTANEQYIVDNIQSYGPKTASVFTHYLLRRQYCPGCATLRIAQLLAALLAKSPERMERTIAALTAGHASTTGDDAVSEGLGQSLASDTWTRTVCRGVEYMTDMYHALMSGVNVYWSLGRKAAAVGDLIVRMLDGMVFDMDTEEAITKTSDLGLGNTALWKFGSIIRELADDERFSCAPFRKDCFRHAGRLRPQKNQLARGNASNTALPVFSKGLALEAGWSNSNLAPTLPSVVEKSASVTTASVTASIVPGGPRRSLLPRGERHQRHSSAMKAAVQVAGMGTRTAKKMSDFCVLQQKAYERAGLALSPDILYCMQRIKRIAYTKSGTRAQDDHDCHCPPCVAARARSVDKTSKFVENFSETYHDQFEVTIGGRAITDDELLGYTGATMERIRSIASGEAKLEYICWIAHKVSLDADASQAAGKKWTLPIKRFKDFFTCYAPIPRELELALEYAKGKLWPSPDCLMGYPIVEWTIIKDILAIMGRIGAKKLTLAHGSEDCWRLTSPLVPSNANGNGGDVTMEDMLRGEAAPIAPFEPVDFALSNPLKSEQYSELSRTEVSAREGFEASAFDASVERLRQMVLEGKIEECKELIQTGLICARSTREVKHVSTANPGISSLVPEPLKVRKDGSERAVNADSSAEAESEALALSQKQPTSSGERQQTETETDAEVDHLLSEKERRQTEAIQAQIEFIRQIDEKNATLSSEATSPPLTENSIRRLFESYDASAGPIVEYLSTISDDDWKPDEDPRIEVAVRVQMQYFDCMRMIQLIAESKGWGETAARMGGLMEECGLREDEEGHYPDFWDASETSDEEGGENGGTDHRLSSTSAPGQEA